MRVKVFTGALEGNIGFQHLEEEVNNWLGKMSVDFTRFSTISRHVSNCAGTNIKGETFVNCTIAVFYTT